MKALLKILYVLLILVIIVLVAGIFLPKEAHISSSIEINAPDEIVFDQINDLENWEAWSPWKQMDTTMKISYGSQTVGEGASYSWTSIKSGDGNMTITESVPLNKIGIELDFGEQGKADSYWILEQKDNLTNLTWSFDNEDLSYMDRYFMVIFRKTMINSFNQGLNGIKEIAEDLRLSRISEIKVVNLEKQPVMAIIDSCKLEEMETRMDEMFNGVVGYLERRKMQTTGPPLAIYYTWNPDGISTFACGFPIEKRTWGYKEFTVIDLPEGEAATVIHWGKYDSPKPYLAMDKFLAEKGKSAEDYIWEVYLNDPESEPDTGMWQKQIYYPIKAE